ncbi:tRNA (adenosine(37)-N6)-threonylcarbamoyltransferase complex ATPase subunit type 1 TsaE [Lacinutrix undariae]
MELKYQLNEIEHVAKTVLDLAKTKTLLFYGEMGVGKTTLIKNIVQKLGCLDTVNSPTFSIVNEYNSNSGLIYHFDLYRIDNEEEALNFGIEDYLYSNEWILMEWPEKIHNLLPEHATIITIIASDDTFRTLKIEEKII